MRIAVVDCGTNTFNLLIADDSSGTIDFIYEDKIPVKIGKGGIENKTIVEDAYARALEAMKSYAHAIKNYSVDKIIATSTSAFRSTDNGPQLRQDIFDQTGIDVRIISGDEEADYIYKGVTWTFPPEEDKRYLIMDIGGGSTEFILYDREKIYFRESYLLGASRLLEKFKPSDPLSEYDLDNYYGYFKGVLNDSLIKVCKQNPPDILVGSSGFFDTLRKICYHKFHSDQPEMVKQVNCRIDLSEFNACYHLMLPLNEEERKQIRGMTPFRAEMMGVSTLLVDYIIRETKVSYIINTSYALKEGVMRLAFGK
jgi:exopolyphosphatase / guanosine-5'-triphosphate,3'-diphosphate pyrophosphatase